MNEKPMAIVAINNFAGMASNADPRDLPDETAQIQINFVQVKAGELTSRGGLKRLTFDTPAL